VRGRIVEGIARELVARGTGPLPIVAPALRLVALALVALSLVALTLVRDASAVVYTSYDFEPPSYGETGRLISDFYVLKNAGVWHLYYTELPSPTVAVCRIGHATSPDLVHWTEKPAPLVAGSPSWMSTGVWAPHVVAAPGGGWRMFFTGRSDTGAQSIASASSADLDDWTLTSPDPVWTSPTTWARWSATSVSSCRDPFVWLDAGSGQYRMAYTAMMIDGQPAIGYAGSPDLLHWSDLGPLAVDARVPVVGEMESPFLVFDNGRTELVYTQVQTNILIAPTIAGPWNPEVATIVDGFGRAPEIVKDGQTVLFHRVRGLPCGESTSIVLIDSVTVTPGGYAVPGPSVLTAAWRLEGDAFLDDPTFGDAPLQRGEPPVSPGGFRWLSSSERTQTPSCPLPQVEEATGSASTPTFLLRGDVTRVRVSGASSPDSAYVALVDDCTGLELARQTGPGGNAMVPVTWSNTGRRGWPVRVKAVDRLTRPGGSIGIDDVQDTSVVDQALPSLPSTLITRPISGENLPGGGSFTIRWNASAAAGIDSFVVYVSYDDFATPPQKIAKRNANQFNFTWNVPAITAFGVKTRVVTYAKNAVHGCHTSGAFTISATVGVPADAAGLRLAALGSPGRTPVLVWSTPVPGPARLTVYDALGRRVRSLAADVGSGERRTAWDGTDDAGRDVGPGVYFARLVCEAGERSIPIVRLAR
jgi:hypothetical protein